MDDGAAAIGNPVARDDGTGGTDAELGNDSTLIFEGGVSCCSTTVPTSSESDP